MMRQSGSYQWRFSTLKTTLLRPFLAISLVLILGHMKYNRICKGNWYAYKGQHLSYYWQDLHVGKKMTLLIYGQGKLVFNV